MRLTNVEVWWQKYLGRTTGQPVSMPTFEPRTSKYEATLRANPIEISETALFTVGPQIALFSQAKEQFLKSKQP
jgi:hypothetical protein